MFAQQSKFKVRVSNVYSDKSNFRTKQKCSLVKNTQFRTFHESRRALDKYNVTRTLKKLKCVKISVCKQCASH